MKLVVDQLNIRYDQEKVIRDLHFKVDEGSFFTILGKSGSGKSTILKAIAGLHNKQTGSIQIDGKEITTLPTESRQVAYVFQKPSLFPHLTVEANIRFGPEVHGWSKNDIDARIARLMGLVQIEGLGQRMPKEISGGQQQRVAIARALALNHKLLLMDEPFSSLDPDLREDMGQMVKKIQKELGLTVIFVTHDVHEAMALSDRICFLSDGHLIQCGTGETLYNYPKTKEIGDFMGKSIWLDGLIDQGTFMSPFGPIKTRLPNGSKASLLLRPHDLTILPSGKDYKVLSSRRVGRETLTTVTKGGQALVVAELKKSSHHTGDFIGVGLLNDYGHLIKTDASI